MPHWFSVYPVLHSSSFSLDVHTQSHRKQERTSDRERERRGLHDRSLTTLTSDMRVIGILRRTWVNACSVEQLFILSRLPSRGSVVRSSRPRSWGEVSRAPSLVLKLAYTSLWSDLGQLSNAVWWTLPDFCRMADTFRLMSFGAHFETDAVWWTL